MVDLHHCQGTRGLKRSGNGRCRLEDLLFAAALGSFLEVDVLEAGHYRSAMRRLQSNRDAVCLHVPHQLRDRRSGPLQVEPFDSLANDLLPLLVQRTMTLRPSALTIDKRQNGPAGAEQLDQPVGRRLADIHLGSEPGNVCRGRTVRIALQEFTDRIRPPASFIPKRFVNLVRKWIVHGRLARKHREPHSHIK